LGDLSGALFVCIFFRLWSFGLYPGQAVYSNENHQSEKRGTAEYNLALGQKRADKAAKYLVDLGIEKEDLGTEKRLRDLVVAKLGENSLFVVSNREPYIHVFDAERNETKVMLPASGVVTAIDPIMRACGGTWVAHGSGNADTRFVNSRQKTLSSSSRIITSRCCRR